MYHAGLPDEGSRVSVYWPGDRNWYHGEVKVVDNHGRSYVMYDDGQVETLHFAVERFKLADTSPSPGTHEYDSDHVEQITHEEKL